MPSLREPARHPLPRLLARVLILVLVTGLLPADARASAPTPPAGIGSHALPDLASAAPASAKDVLVCVVVVVADPSRLTKSAFGELLAHTGTDPQPYAFAGEPLDLQSAWQYHRARWLDPRTGRFASTDPWPGLAFDPPSLHKYLYANVDPINRTDPSGRYTLTQTLTIGAIIGALAGAVIGGGIAYARGYTISESAFWYWVGGGALAGAAVGAIASWALIKFGLISVGYVGSTAPAINWLANNGQRAWHIIHPDHLWERIVNLPVPNVPVNALQNYQAILPHLDKITSASPTTIQTLANGAQLAVWQVAYLGQQVVVRVWLSPTGQRLISDAWVVP